MQQKYTYEGELYKDKAQNKGKQITGYSNEVIRVNVVSILNCKVYISRTNWNQSLGMRLLLLHQIETLEIGRDDDIPH